MRLSIKPPITHPPSKATPLNAPSSKQHHQLVTNYSNANVQALRRNLILTSRKGKQWTTATKIQTSSFILISCNKAGYNEKLGWRFYWCVCQKVIKAHRRDTQEDKTLEGNIETELEDCSAVKGACLSSRVKFQCCWTTTVKFPARKKSHGPV